MSDSVPPLLVIAWNDPAVDATAVDPRSEYAERFWLPVLGPTATWLMRRFAYEFDRAPDGFSLDATDAARSIGVGTRGGQNGAFGRSIARCARFGLIHPQEHDILAVRRRLPPLDRSQLARLPRRVRHQHDDWVGGDAERAPAPPTPSDGHATRLARSLLDVGADVEEVVVQLGRWNFTIDDARRALDRALAAPTGA